MNKMGGLHQILILKLINKFYSFFFKIIMNESEIDHEIELFFENVINKHGLNQNNYILERWVSHPKYLIFAYRLTKIENQNAKFYGYMFASHIIDCFISKEYVYDQQLINTFYEDAISFLNTNEKTNYRGIVVKFISYFYSIVDLSVFNSNLSGIGEGTIIKILIDVFDQDSNILKTNIEEQSEFFSCILLKSEITPDWISLFNHYYSMFIDDSNALDEELQNKVLDFIYQTGMNGDYKIILNFLSEDRSIPAAELENIIDTSEEPFYLNFFTVFFEVAFAKCETDVFFALDSIIVYLLDSITDTMYTHSKIDFMMPILSRLLELLSALFPHLQNNEDLIKLFGNILYLIFINISDACFPAMNEIVLKYVSLLFDFVNSYDTYLYEEELLLNKYNCLGQDLDIGEITDPILSNFDPGYILSISITSRDVGILFLDKVLETDPTGYEQNFLHYFSNLFDESITSDPKISERKADIASYIYRCFYQCQNNVTSEFLYETVSGIPDGFISIRDIIAKSFDFQILFSHFEVNVIFCMLTIFEDLSLVFEYLSKVLQAYATENMLYIIELMKKIIEKSYDNKNKKKSVIMTVFQYILNSNALFESSEFAQQFFIVLFDLRKGIYKDDIADILPIFHDVFMNFVNESSINTTTVSIIYELYQFNRSMDLFKQYTEVFIETHDDEIISLVLCNIMSLFLTGDEDVLNYIIQKNYFLDYCRPELLHTSKQIVMLINAIVRKFPGETGLTRSLSERSLVSGVSYDVVLNLYELLRPPADMSTNFVISLLREILYKLRKDEDNPTFIDTLIANFIDKKKSQSIKALVRLTLYYINKNF